MKIKSLLSLPKMETQEVEPTEDLEVEEVELLSSESGPEEIMLWDPQALAFHGPTSRSILLSGEVCQEMANDIISKMLMLMSLSEEDPITLYINTDGGDIISGLAIYDFMRTITCPVVAIVSGACHSAGLFILQGADLRVANHHASFFYHEPVAAYEAHSYKTNSTFSDLYKLHCERVNHIMLKRSKMKKSVWKKDFADKTAHFFTSEQALEYGLIDEVIEYAKPKPIKVDLE